MSAFVALALAFNGVSPAPKGTVLSPVLTRRAPVASVEAPSYLQVIARGAYVFYRETLSEAKGRTCRFSPSCSLYGHQAIERFGLLPGLVLFAGRLIRAHVNYGELQYREGPFPELMHSLEDSVPFVNSEEKLPWTAHFDSLSR